MKIQSKVDKFANEFKLSKITALSYFNRIKFIFEKLFNKPWDLSFEFLKDHDTVSEYINNKYKKPNTKATYFKSIYSVLIKIYQFDNVVVDIYRNWAIKYTKIYQNNKSLNVMNDKQKNKFIKYDDIINFDPPENIQDRLIYQLLLFCPRRPSAYINLIFSPHDDKINNCIVINDQYAFIFLNKYKTVKFFGPYKLELDIPMKHLFAEHIKHQNISHGQHIFKNSSGKIFSQSNFSNYIKNIFFNVTGKPLCSTDIRIIYISNIKFDKLSHFQLNNIALRLGHKLNSSLDYRKFDI